MSAGREPWPTNPYQGNGAVPANGAASVNPGAPAGDSRCPSAAFEPQSIVGPPSNARAGAPTTNPPTTNPPTTAPPSTIAPALSALEHGFPLNSFQIGTATISHPFPDPVTERRLSALEAAMRALRNNKRHSRKKKSKEK